jgi:hypothetical protein
MAIHHPDEAFNHIIYIAKRSGLLTISVDCDVLSLKRLNDEIAHYATVIGVHAWAVGIEDPDHLNLKLVLSPVVKK